VWSTVWVTGAMVMSLITSHLSWRQSEKLAREDHTAEQLKLDQEQRPWWWRLIGR
jgi:hypothetical protein